eukprot:TRINITY_DN27799_c0_g1_i1.p1 TRINITY_DN27799_c0_g1~~TRINITY_DN27799_c0_g1_i1.p1  ORF type:complete len:152 (+),score=17.01 TRINITY_DN27799_c0_g1_i1:321-776(+)
MSQARKPVATVIRLVINAGGAKPAPPVGPALGQHGLNLMAFCKDFNARTQHFRPEVPIPVLLTAYKDRTFDFIIKSPRVSYLLKKAAGIHLGSTQAGHETAGVVTLKHIYHIALIKQQDPDCQYMPLIGICRSIIGSARSIGITVKRSLDD